MKLFVVLSFLFAVIDRRAVGSGCSSGHYETSCEGVLNGWRSGLEPLTVKPSARCGHSGIGWNGKMIIFAGSSTRYSDGVKNDLHILELSSFTWTTPATSGTVPEKRYRHTAIKNNDKMVVFGGYGSTYLNDVYELDLPTWVWSKPSISGTSPTARYTHVAVYHNNKMYIFGGYGDNGGLSDMHALDLMSWKWNEVIIASNPSLEKRYLASAVMWNNKFIFFGGYKDDCCGGGTIYNDVFVLDLSESTLAWHQQTTTGTKPISRYAHSAAIVKNDFMVIFGGAKAYGTLLSDLHILDLNSWEWNEADLELGKPTARRETPLIVSSGKMTLVGGRLSNGCSDYLYTLDLCQECSMCMAGRWSIAGANECKLCSPGQYSAEGAELCEGCPAGTVSEWNGAMSPGENNCTNSWLPGIVISGKNGDKPSSPRWGSSFVKWNDKLIIFGGYQYSGGYKDGTYVLDLITWKWGFSDITGDKPQARYLSSAVAYNNKMVIFGGYKYGGTRLNDLWYLDLDGATWNRPNTAGTKPSARCGHSAVLYEKFMIVFGGATSTEYFNDVHILNLNQSLWAWSKQTISQTSPVGRLCHSAVIFDSQMIVFGGQRRDYESRNDVHVLDLQRWAWFQPSITGTKPTERSGHSAIVRHRTMFIFGGRHSSRNNLMNDVHMLDLKSWSWKKLHVEGVNPGPRAFFSMVFSQNKLVIFGGMDEEKEEFDDVRALHLCQPCTTCSAGKWSAAKASNCTDCAAGTYSGPSGSGECNDCDAGKWSIISAGSCTNCSVGKWSAAKASNCTDCAAGTYSGPSGSGKCYNCDAGKWSIVSAGSCTNCSGGKWSLENSSNCTNCESGFFSTLGSGQCNPCPSGRWSNTGSATCTICPSGRWGLADATYCEACPAGRFSNQYGAVDANVCKLCPTGTFSPYKSSEKCTRCPRDKLTDEVGSMNASDCYCRPGMYDVNKDTCRLCPNVKACLGGTQCLSGYHGTLCGICKNGWYKWESRCLTCPSSMWPTLVAVSLLGFLAIGLYCAGIDKDKIARLKLVTHFLQIAAFATIMSVVWPSAVIQLMELFSVIGSGIEIVHPECHGQSWNPHRRLWAAALITAICLFILFLMEAWNNRKHALIEKRKSRGIFQNANADAKIRAKAHGLRAIIILFVTLAYSPLVRYSLAVFECVEESPGEWVLRKDTSTSCMSMEHQGTVVGAIVCLVVIGAGLPAWIIFKLQSVDLQDGTVLDTYGDLYTLYSEEVPWFDAVTMLRKFFMLGFLTIFTGNGIAQALSQIIVSVFYGIFVLCKRPFRPRRAVLWKCAVNDLYNWLEFWGTCVHTFNNVLGLLLTLGVYSANSLGSILLFVNILMVLVTIQRYQTIVGGYSSSVKTKAVEMKQVKIFRSKEAQSIYKKWVKKDAILKECCKRGNFNAAKEEKLELNDIRQMLLAEINCELENTDNDERVKALLELKSKVDPVHVSPLHLSMRFQNARDEFQKQRNILHNKRQSALHIYSFLDAKDAQETIWKLVKTNIALFNTLLVESVEIEAFETSKDIYNVWKNFTIYEKKSNNECLSACAKLRKRINHLKSQSPSIEWTKIEALDNENLRKLLQRKTQYEKEIKLRDDLVEQFNRIKPLLESAHQYIEANNLWTDVVNFSKGWSPQGNKLVPDVKPSKLVEEINEKKAAMQEAKLRGDFSQYKELKKGYLSWLRVQEKIYQKNERKAASEGFFHKACIALQCCQEIRTRLRTHESVDNDDSLIANRVSRAMSRNSWAPNNV